MNKKPKEPDYNKIAHKYFDKIIKEFPDGASSQDLYLVLGGIQRIIRTKKLV